MTYTENPLLLAGATWELDNNVRLYKTKLCKLISNDKSGVVKHRIVCYVLRKNTIIC